MNPSSGDAKPNGTVSQAAIAEREAKKQKLEEAKEAAKEGTAKEGDGKKAWYLLQLEKEVKAEEAKMEAATAAEKAAEKAAEQAALERESARKMKNSASQDSFLDEVMAYGSDDDEDAFEREFGGGGHSSDDSMEDGSNLVRRLA